MSVPIGGFSSGYTNSTVGGFGTVIKYFPQQAGTTGPGSVSTTTYQLPVPGSNRLNGQKWSVDLTGACSTDPLIACPTINVTLSAITIPGTGSTSGMAANPIVLGTLGATAAGNTDGDVFQLTFTFYGDNFSGICGGTYTGQLNGVQVRSSTATTVLTGIDWNGYLSAATPLVGSTPGSPAFYLVAGVTFGTTGANNKAYLYQFQLSS